MHQPTTIEELGELVRSQPHILVRGGGTKTALSAGSTISMSALSGVSEYDPSEFTFTAKAGTPLLVIRDMLAQHGQYLPFDAPMVERGATLGGTVASGLSGPGRFRYGGVRDFLLGVRFLTSDGELVTGGGRVVKNAAGFDFPKLMVGACGSFGIITEMTMKVFPRPKSYATLIGNLPTIESAAEVMLRLARSSLELACLDLVPRGRLLLRVGGLDTSIAKRVERIQKFAGMSLDVLTGPDDEEIWREAREFAWVGDDETLVKVPVNPMRVIECEEELGLLNLHRRYSVGGNVLWLAWPNAMGRARLQSLFEQLGLVGMAVVGERWGMIGERPESEFAKRLTSVCDPAGRFTAVGLG